MQVTAHVMFNITLMIYCIFMYVIVIVLLDTLSNGAGKNG